MRAAGWPSLADLLATAALPTPPPLPQTQCNATMSYPRDCGRRDGANMVTPTCFAENASCGFELGTERFGINVGAGEVDHRAFRCGTQCLVDFGGWDLGCDTDIFFPPLGNGSLGGGGAAFVARGGALGLSNECYATAFLQMLGVAHGIGDGICVEEAAVSPQLVSPQHTTCLSAVYCRAVYTCLRYL